LAESRSSGIIVVIVVLNVLIVGAGIDMGSCSSLENV
jgi:hypothetical protein